MSIAKAKELEDVKEEIAIEEKAYTEARKQKKMPLYEVAIREFTDYFTQQGFTLQSGENSVTASYKKLQFRYHFSPANNNSYEYIQLSSLEKEALCYVNENLEPTVRVRHTLLSLDNNIEYEIKSAKNRLEELKIGREALDQIQFRYVLSIKDNRGNSTRHSFDSFTELLNHFFNK